MKRFSKTHCIETQNLKDRRVLRHTRASARPVYSGRVGIII